MGKCKTMNIRTKRGKKFNEEYLKNEREKLTMNTREK